MKNYLIPATDLEVSALCCGTGGSIGTSVLGEDTDWLFADFLEAGGNFFDTAHCYSFWLENGLGTSERELGASLRRLGALDRVVIATKGGHPDGGEAYRRPDAYMSEAIVTSDLNESLERLNIERIDLYYLHRDDPRVPVDEIIDMLNKEIERGRIRFIAASNWPVQRIAAANEYARRKGLHGFVMSQVQWSLADPDWKQGPDPTNRSVTIEEVDWHTATEMPVAAYSATAGGYFAKTETDTSSYDSLTNRARRTRAQSLAKQYGCTPTQIALAYLMNHSFPVMPIFGTSKREHMAEILGSALIPLTPEQVEWLRAGGNEEPV